MYLQSIESSIELTNTKQCISVEVHIENGHRKCTGARYKSNSNKTMNKKKIITNSFHNLYPVKPNAHVVYMLI